MDNKQLPIIFIYGPTAVGKTDVSEGLAKAISGEVINMDSSQCYTALKVGTAKPDWRSSSTVCHLFDIIDSPVTSSVVHYQEQARAAIQLVRQKGKTPIFVGGSGFYLMSLLYPPVGKSLEVVCNRGTWRDLYAIDPDRAVKIHANDQYRIDRALTIWHETGIKPSLYAPIFNPPGDFKVFFLQREREELRQRIQMRTAQMLEDGFIEEVQSLGDEWHAFLKRKKIIGYPEVIAYLNSERTAHDYRAMKERIISKTMGYTKRQRVFWHMLEKRLNDIKKTAICTAEVNFDVDVINLTLSGLDLYIKQLSQTLLYSK